MNSETRQEQDKARPEELQGSEQIPAVVRSADNNIKLYYPIRFNEYGMYFGCGTLSKEMADQITARNYEKYKKERGS